MKRYLFVFCLGVCTPLVAGLHAGGENVAQLGFRLAAIEQGFALAGRHWQFDAIPEHDAVTAETPPAPAPKKLVKR